MHVNSGMNVAFTVALLEYMRIIKKDFVSSPSLLIVDDNAAIVEFLTNPIDGRELLERLHAQLALRRWERK